MSNNLIEREKAQIKPGFEKRYKALCGNDYDNFIDYSLRFLRRSIRVNTLKITIEEVKESLGKNWVLTPIPWCKEGFWVEHKEGRRDIGNTMEHILGYIYVQEAASMIPPVVLEPKPEEIILDMCASPGSKTTQIGQYMENTGLLIANDFKGDRLSPLGINVQRVGLTNDVLTLSHGHKLESPECDRILVDAPCSGTGTIRKSLKTLLTWNENSVKRLSGLQKLLIKNAFEHLKTGGILVYSTCTLEPEEDEEVIDFLIKEFPNAKVEEININLKRGEPVVKFEGKTYSDEVKKCLRIWPQDNDTEGFFVAKIRKV